MLTRETSDPTRPGRKRARRGSGMLYQQRRRDGSLGPTWWTKIYVHGRPVRESTATEDRNVAEGILRDRLTRADQGLPVVRLHEVRFDELAEDLKTHYETTGSRNLTEAEKRLAPLRRFFAGWRAARIDGAAFDRYVQKRQAGGTGNGTINRERSVLLKMLRLALERGKLARLPILRALKEPPPRQGFFEPEQYAAVRRALGPDLQVALDIAYTYGWRMQSEVLTLTRRQVDLAGGRLILEAGTTKNGEGREVFLTPPLKAALVAQLARVDALGFKLGRIIACVFPHLIGAKGRTATTRGPVLGEQRANFRKAWLTACKKAGVAGRLRHDLRRTAVRNLVRAGVPERVSMEITGHKTRSVFDRYDIVSEADKRAASERLMGMISGIAGGHMVESRSAKS
ncbi:MAG TPA: tyrosine-type recombinase/integrase [Methylomirabilota bacterium]|jgi:integrase|nr:tyrosine-type recombinase/integrase [Methylomirabilota bacterium]